MSVNHICLDIYLLGPVVY